MNEKYTPSIHTLLTNLMDHVVIPHVFNGPAVDRPNYSGSVEVEGKLYALYFRRNSNSEVEVSITRNANVVKWTYHKDMFTKTLQVSHTPSAGACGHAAYLNDPWLLMRIFATYVDISALRDY
jgi:hypothetical protein